MASDFGTVVCTALAAGNTALFAQCLRAERALEGEKRYAGAFVQQTGQLDKANGRTVDVIGITGRCEALINEARPG